MTNTWAKREQPILDAVAELMETEDDIRWEQVQEATGLSVREVQLGLRRLYDADYLTGIDATSPGDTFYLLNIQLQERGLVQAGVWPGDPYDELVSALNEAIATEGDPERQTKLERLLAATVDIGKGVASGLLVEVAKRAASA